MNVVFFTNRDTLLTKFIHPENKLEKNYFPIKYETLSYKKIHNFQKSFTNRFLRWAIFNKNKIMDETDYQIVNSRVKDIYYSLACCGIFALSFNFILKNIQAPFLRIYLEERLGTTKTLRIFVVGVLTSFFLYDSFTSFGNRIYLYDIALKYKELFAPGELISENCEEEVQKVLKKYC